MKRQGVMWSVAYRRLELSDKCEQESEEGMREEPRG